MKQKSRSQYSLMARPCNNIYDIHGSLNAYFFIDGILFSLNNPMHCNRSWAGSYHFTRCISVCFDIKLNTAYI
jgi:hypothetical protein